MIHQHQNGDEGQAVLRELDRIHKKNLWTYQHIDLLIAFHSPNAVQALLNPHTIITQQICYKMIFTQTMP